MATIEEENAGARVEALESSPPDSLTHLERAALIKAIVAEMRKDSLKQEVSSKLTKARPLDLVSGFLQHPATLVVIGFVCTGLAGGWIAERWQRQEWNRQQLRLIDIRGADLKYDIANEMTKSIGERNAAAMGILTPLDEEKLTDQQLISEEVDRIKIWNTASNQWRTTAQVLSGKIASRIKNREIGESFEKILDKERKIGAKVNVIKLDLARYHRADDKKVQKYLGELHTLIEDTKKALTPLVKAIAAEADADINRP
jgi:hypothetical protein